MNGILLIDKEAGITSYDVIRKLKKQLPHKQKIGHAGTLDPFATGLLIILLGRATKLVNQIHTYKKGYQVKAQFGFETDTQDITGTKISESTPLTQISLEQINEKIESFKGEIEQIPPRYSAVKINGSRAYDMARSGKEFEIKPKKITVHQFKVINYEWPYVEFELDVSTGTYVRTIIADLGRGLSTFATAVELRRTYIGPYSAEQALSSAQIDKSEIDNLLIPLQ